MTPAEALDALDAVLTAAGVRTSREPAEDDPPVAVLFSDGGDMRSTRRDGSTPWALRVVVLAGAWDFGGSSTMLNDTLHAVASAIWAAPAFTLDRVSGVRSIIIGGGNRLAADVFATTTVQL